MLSTIILDVDPVMRVQAFIQSAMWQAISVTCVR